jgi:Ser/Thr protein kinase RdoA (MazF antagonist)
MHSQLEAFHKQRQSVFYPKADLPLPDELLRPRPAPPPAQADQQVAAREACRRVFGRAPADVRPLGETGTFHTLYRAVLPDGRRRIVRFNALSDRQPDFPLLVDAAIMPRLAACQLPCLAVDLVDLSRRWCPWDYEILQEAEGTPLKALDHDDALIVPLLQTLGNIVARLHDIRTEGFGLVDVRPLAAEPSKPQPLCGVHTSWCAYLTVRLPEQVGTCVDLGALTVAEAEAVFRLFELFPTVCPPSPPSLLHGDLGNHNVFGDGAAITALIDWEDALSGDPVFDIAFWATFHPERRHRAFLNGYESIRPLPADFALRFWVYFLRVAIAKTVLRHRLGLTDVPGRPPAALRVRKGLEQAEALLEPLAA